MSNPSNFQLLHVRLFFNLLLSDEVTQFSQLFTGLQICANVKAEIRDCSSNAVTIQFDFISCSNILAAHQLNFHASNVYFS
jgi:hypothetical protein